MNKETVLLIILILIVLAPRRYVRKIRGYPSRFVFWQWKKMAHLSAIIYSLFYDMVNGNGNGD